MRIFLAVLFVFACASANAECVGGRCSTRCSNGRCGTMVRQPVRTVTKSTVGTVRNVTKGAVEIVTPPYGCANGRCRVK